MLEKILPSTVKIASANPSHVEGSLHPQEHSLTHKMGDKRKREFCASRLLAKTLLSQFDIQDFPLLMGEHRAPLWPENICGSITHTNSYCAVTIALKNDIQSIGIDAEKISRVNSNIHDHICQNDEWQWVQTLPDEERQKYLALIFSAKECFYKCQFPLTQNWLNFKDVLISIDPTIYAFKATITNPSKNTLKEHLHFNGKFIFENDLVITAMTI